MLQLSSSFTWIKYSSIWCYDLKVVLYFKNAQGEFIKCTETAIEITEKDNQKELCSINPVELVLYSKEYESKEENAKLKNGINGSKYYITLKYS